MKKTFFAIILFFILCIAVVTQTSAHAITLPNTNPQDSAPAYNMEKVMETAREQNFAPESNCAEFVGACLRAAGIIDKDMPGCTTLNQTLCALPNVDVHHVSYPEGAQNLQIDAHLAEKLTAGDVIIYYCRYCAENFSDPLPFIHTLFYVYTDSEGYVHGISRNPWESEEEVYWYYSNCYDCFSPLSDVFSSIISTAQAKAGFHPSMVYTIGIAMRNS